MEHCAQAVTIISCERKLRSRNIALCGLAYKLDLLDIDLLGKVVDLAERELYLFDLGNCTSDCLVCCNLLAVVLHR